MAHNATQVDPKEVQLSKEILKFLKDGEDKMDIGKFKNVTLVLGFTGSGKSTLTQFITGNDDGLFAEENGVDTGEFTITDKNNNVCRETIESCTIIPKLYVDKEMNSAFYDCPGFGDTRSAKHDISVTYFIKKVVDSVEAVKLLFVVNYPSVRQGVDRQNFMLLVKNVINMVKNVEKFKDSIALAVTKVDNQYIVKRGQAVLVPDRTIISNIAKFLEGAKNSLSAKLSQDADSKVQAFIQNAIKFIDILLEKNGDSYPKIGLFRRPDEGGKLRETILMKFGKEKFDKILRENIHYIPKTAEDFGYTLSADSLNHMHSLIFNINEDLALNFQTLAAPIHEHYLFQETESQNIDELSKNFTSGHERLLKIKESRNYSSPIVLMNEIGQLAKDENIALSGEIMANIDHYDHFLNFLDSISGLTTSPLQWLQGLNDVVDKMSRSRNWLDLLLNLKGALFKYEVLNEVRKNQNAANTLTNFINTYEESRSDGGLTASLQEFLRQVFKDDFEKEYGKMANLQNVSIEEWNLLKDLLDFRVMLSCTAGAVTMNDVQLFHFEAPTFMLVGQYVKLSDLQGISCSSKRIYIFALRKVFIDVNFSAKWDKTELVIMAPSWEVVGSPNINVDGQDGMSADPRKARDGGSYYLHGADGQSGENGGAGGFFWGIGQNCINCQHLTISANGGIGGAGQDGGDGAAGRDFYYEHVGDQDGLLITLLYSTRVWDKVRIGQRGGNGGNGGNGGSGGPKGTIQFVMFDNGRKPKIGAVDGQPGRAGAGGAPGRGGASDRIIQRVQAVLIIPWEKNEVQNLPPASYGDWGLNGGVPRGTYSLPERYPSPAKTLANYTQLLQSKIFKGPTDETSRLFLQNLGKTKMVDLDRHRWRRHTSECAPDECTASSASVKGSIIKQVMLLISSIIKPFWKPLNAINWLSENGIELRDLPKAKLFNGIERGTQNSFEPQKIAGQSFESQVEGYNHSSLNVHSNLLLLDYLVRMKIGGKRDTTRKNNAMNNGDHAHLMAYSAHTPINNSE